MSDCRSARAAVAIASLFSAAGPAKNRAAGCSRGHWRAPGRAHRQRAPSRLSDSHARCFGRMPVRSPHVTGASPTVVPGMHWRKDMATTLHHRLTTKSYREMPRATAATRVDRPDRSTPARRIVLAVAGALVVFAPLFASTPVRAESASATMSVSVVVRRSCTVNVDPSRKTNPSVEIQCARGAAHAVRVAQPAPKSSRRETLTVNF
jgi:hypothetical protein